MTDDKYDAYLRTLGPLAGDDLAKEITALHWPLMHDDASVGEIARAGRAAATLVENAVIPVRFDRDSLIRLLEPAPDGSHPKSHITILGEEDAAYYADRILTWIATQIRPELPSRIWLTHPDGSYKSSEEIVEESAVKQGYQKPIVVDGRELVDQRDPECVKAWPDCESMAYDPACCRFPKSCSAGGFKWMTPEEKAAADGQTD